MKDFVDLTYWKNEKLLRTETIEKLSRVLQISPSYRQPSFFTDFDSMYEENTCEFKVMSTQYVRAGLHAFLMGNTAAAVVVHHKSN
jgi:hypothetical protein